VTKPKSRRIVSIQVCRGVAALLVVLAHLHGIETKYTASNHLLLFEHVARVIIYLRPPQTSILVISLIGLPAVLLVGCLSYVYLERPLLQLLHKSAPPRQTAAKQPA
jgi:peptidoglycan/LPS O-acetylase OafA/YrhL